MGSLSCRSAIQKIAGAPLADGGWNGHGVSFVSLLFQSGGLQGTGTRSFSSSNQFLTMSMAGGAGSPAA